jgi:hypothetical protein
MNKKYPLAALKSMGKVEALIPAFKYCSQTSKVNRMLREKGKKIFSGLG